MTTTDTTRLIERLIERCRRNVYARSHTTNGFRLVFEPVGDKGRLDLAVTIEDSGLWKITDRGVTANILGEHWDSVVEHVTRIGTPFAFADHQITASTFPDNAVDIIGLLVSHIEALPAISGIWEELTAA